MFSHSMYDGFGHLAGGQGKMHATVLMERDEYNKKIQELLKQNPTKTQGDPRVLLSFRCKRPRWDEL